MTTHMTIQEYHDYLQSDKAPNAIRQQRERDELVHPLMDMFQLHKWRVHHEEDSRRDVKSDNGFPDLVALRPPHRIVIECKLDGYEPSPDQEKWLDDERQLVEGREFHWVCVWHLSQYDAALGYIQHPDKVTPPGVWKG